MNGIHYIEVEYREKPLPEERTLAGPALILTASVIEAIDGLLPKRVGRKQHENVLYIAGIIESMRRVGLAVIAPKAETGPGYYRTDRASHGEVLDALGELGLVIVAQVHCHPGEGVYHSDPDDDLAFVRAEGHWSIVVPHYGLRGMLPLAQCGFHRLHQGAFAFLSEEAVEARVKVVPPSVRLVGNI